MGHKNPPISSHYENSLWHFYQQFYIIGYQPSMIVFSEKGKKGCLVHWQMKYYLSHLKQQTDISFEGHENNRGAIGRK